MGLGVGGGGEEAAVTAVAPEAAVGRPASCCQNGSVETLLRSGLIDSVVEMVEVTEQAGEERAGAAGAEPERRREWSSEPVNTLTHSSSGICVASGEAGRESGDGYMAARQVARSLMINFGRPRFTALPARSLVMEWVW